MLPQLPEDAPLPLQPLAALRVEGLLEGRQRPRELRPLGVHLLQQPLLLPREKLCSRRCSSRVVMGLR